MPKSDAELVKEFTEGARGPVPDKPQLMSKEDIFFLSKMMLDEIMEMLATVAKPKEAKEHLIKCITESKDISLDFEGMSDVELIGEVSDALIDCYYYSLDTAARKGINLSKVFNIVHAANLSKKDPETGLYLKRADNKILKPIGWKPPNITAEIEKQIKEGAWSLNQNISAPHHSLVNQNFLSSTQQLGVDTIFTVLR